MQKDDIRHRFGARIRKLRTDRGWSQEGFADRAGLHRTYVGSVERGEQNISLENIERLATTLGVSLAEVEPPQGMPEALIGRVLGNAAVAKLAETLQQRRVRCERGLAGHL